MTQTRPSNGDDPAANERAAAVTPIQRWGVGHYFLVNCVFGAFVTAFVRALQTPGAHIVSEPEVGLGWLLGLGILTGNCVGFSCVAIGTWMRRRWAHLEPEHRTLLYILAFGAAGTGGAVLPLYAFGMLETQGAGVLMLCIGFIASGVSLAIMVIEEKNETLASQYRDRELNERVERDLRIARQVQSAMLPKRIPILPGVGIAARSRPAKEVGGDYYDFLTLADGRLLIAVADVAGKGLPAALLMSALRAGLRTLSNPAIDLVYVTGRLNQLIMDSSDRFNYVTFILGIFDSESLSFDYINAGHNPPIVIARDGRATEAEPGDLVLGVMNDVEYSTRRIQLEPDEILVIYTDGMIEQHGLGAADFGIERLTAVIRAHAQASIEEALDLTYQAVADFAPNDDQYDDQTLVLIQARAPSPAASTAPHSAALAPL